MKSIYLLCDFNIPMSTIDRIPKEYKIDDLVNNFNVVDEIFGHNSAKAINIKNALFKIENIEYNHSVYELVLEGLSNGIADKLFSLGIKIKDISNDESIIYNNFSDSTASKIIENYNILRTKYCDSDFINSGYLYNLLLDRYHFGLFSYEQYLDIKDNYLNTDSDNYFNDLLNAKRMIKIKIGEIVKYKLKSDYKVDSLLEYGLSRTIVANLKEKNITISDIITSIDKIKELFSNSSVNKIYESMFNLMKDNKDVELMNLNMASFILKNEFKDDEFDQEKLINYLTLCISDSDYINNLYNLLLKKGIIINSSNGIRMALPKLNDAIEKLSGLEKEVVLKKLSGLTLENIGNEYNVTRERIRQRLQKALNQLGGVQEDNYKDVFERYSFKCDLFCKLFNEDKNVYYYLREKYKLGEDDVSSMLDSYDLSDEQLSILRDEYNLINYNNEELLVSRVNILVAILKKFNDTVEYSDVINEYNKILDDYNITSLEKLTEDDFRNVDSVLGRSSYILCDAGRYYKYYDINSLDENDINELTEMLMNVAPGDYSSEFFFNNNSLLMKKINIKNEYELHNLLRKIPINPDEKIVYSRMPDIFIECTDKMEFIENVIIEMAPMGIDEFVDYVYENYGHKKTTFKSLLNMSFMRYINNGQIEANCPQFTEEQKEKLESILTEDIYSITTIKQLLNDLYNVDDFKLINNNNMLRLGYKVRGNYIMKNSILNLESYLKNQILTSDYYEIPSEMKKIGSTFSSYLYKFIYDLKLFKFDRDKYITIKKLNNMGITEEQLKEIITFVKNDLPDNEYFNLYTLKEKEYFKGLSKYDLPDCFFETLLSTIPEVKTFSVKNNQMFNKTSDDVSREKFINSFINKNKIYIDDIRKNIFSKYNIELQNSYIKEFINKKKFYLHSGTDCVYLNKDIYNNEVNEFDILQFID